jgi:hypothetical protein
MPLFVVVTLTFRKLILCIFVSLKATSKIMTKTTVSNAENSAVESQLYTYSSVGAASDQGIYFSSASERPVALRQNEFRTPEVYRRNSSPAATSLILQKQIKKHHSKLQRRRYRRRLQDHLKKLTVIKLIAKMATTDINDLPPPEMIDFDREHHHFLQQLQDLHL